MTKDYQYPYLEGLNKAQRAAVVYDDGPVMVIAGAGSGKTRVLVYKLLHLLHQGYAPSKLMALTFTNKAAREMRSRMELLVGGAARHIRMGTFHAIFLRILRMHAERLGYTSSFTVYSSTDSKSRVKAIIKLMNLDDSVYKPNVVHSRISSAKNRLLPPEAYRANSDLIQADVRANMPRIADIYMRYMYELRQSNAMDFDDLLMQTSILFRDHPDVLTYWQEQIDYLLIDEYQDTNFAQYMIARQLMQTKGAIFVVGDDAQSIYSFRGANLDNMLSFGQTFQDAKTFKLEQNYRSSQTIVQAAGGLIAHNEHQIHKEVFSLGEIGEPIEVHEAFTGELEASWVCKSIEGARLRESIGYDSFAVLYRTNAQSRTLEQAFRRHGIPFRIWGGRSFFDHKEIMDVMAYMRLVVNAQDEEAMLRIINYPKRGIGDTTILRVRQRASELGLGIAQVISDPLGYQVEVSKGTAAKLIAFAELLGEMRERAEAEGNLYELVQWIIGRSGILIDLSSDKTLEGKTRMENVKELLSGIEEYIQNSREMDSVPSLGAYLSEVALMTDQDKEEDGSPCVTLMTIHASKGLEFAHVFIVGLEELLFPSAMSNQGRDLEEERRLFYVAITRAEKTCHIGYARERFRNGKLDVARPSRFLRELPQHLLQRTGSLGAPWPSLYQGERSSIPARGNDLPRSFDKGQNFLPTDEPRGRRVHVGRRLGGDAAEPVETHTRLGDLVVSGRVLHKRFGEGEILSLEGSGQEAKAVVRFDTGETKVLLLRFAHLEPID